MARIEARLKELGIVLPTPPAPVASYVPFTIAAAGDGRLVHVSGQVSVDASGGVKGKLGAPLTLEQGQTAARLCGLNLLAQLQAACGGDLDRLTRVLKLTGFVNAAPDFDPIPAVMNGCSDLMVEVFGDAGRHARSAVGVANLPLGFAVEVDGVFQIR
ncbi:MAG: RidA family protein [Hydrogenophilaceae bacterium]|jgi:enamine deaminase RidA (YjgF/YER057c/UK114 family)|nr:RidA family protein [Hydrogenophilaceae bacterium]